MTKFRNVAGSSPVSNWWSNGENQIAFSRGSQAFIAINNDDFELNRTFQVWMSIDDVILITINIFNIIYS